VLTGTHALHFREIEPDRREDVLRLEAARAREQAAPPGERREPDAGLARRGDDLTQRRDGRRAGHTAPGVRQRLENPRGVLLQTVGPGLRAAMVWVGGC
jgi:hypothetical protein